MQHAFETRAVTRTTWKPRFWITAGALLALSALAGPADAGEERIPLTDPALLERLGFEPDAGNVHATPQVYEQLMMGRAERAAAQAATVEARREQIRIGQDAGDSQSPFGTSTVGYSTVNVGFQPIFDDQYTGGLGISCIPGALVTGAAYGELQNLPHGAKLEHVDFRYVDDSAESLEVTVGRACYPDDFGDGNPSALLLGVHDTTGAEGFVRFASIGPLDEDVDLQSCFYFAQIVTASPCPEDGGLGVFQVRAQWRRQVGLAPDTATFGDVPTGHPFFQHVEALAASGITGGCGGGDYCPDSSLTRGQMAVFMAKALGLHWGEISQP